MSGGADESADRMDRSPQASRRHDTGRHSVVWCGVGWPPLWRNSRDCGSHCQLRGLVYAILLVAAQRNRPQSKLMLQTSDHAPTTLWPTAVRADLKNFGLGGLVASGLNPTAQFVGSYHWNVSLSDGNLDITITNTTTAWSAFYHAPLFNPNPPTRTGWQPFGRINQTFHIQVPCS